MVFKFNMKIYASFLVLLLAAGGGWYWWSHRALDVSYVTQEVTRGDVKRIISASGTLNPVTVVNVGTQVSGVARKVYADFNDTVKEGQVLLELDQSLMQSQLAQNKASLASARASLALAGANYTRAQALFTQQFISQADLDQSRQALDAAKAQVSSAQAQVDYATTNLGYTVIKSPVSGVVISRTIDVGQTVAASFQTPTLFTIAEDLRKMQIYTNLSEADVGAVKEGMPATFTVDAFPDKMFKGLVRQVRLNPTTVQNVVTYNVVIDVPNDDQILLPGMTAFVSLVVAEADNVLRVPSLALSFRPGEGYTKVAKIAAGVSGTVVAEKAVYVLDNGKPKRITVEAGLADDRMTAVSSTLLKPGMAVITGKAGSTDTGKGRGPRMM